VNLTSAFLLSKAVYPHMKQAGGGKIINIGSMTSYFGASFASPYATSKGGIVQLSKSLALAWAADNIQVNALLPGWFETELTDGARARSGAVRTRIGSHSGRPLGQAGGHRRDGDLAGEPGQRLRHRRRDPGGRRLFIEFVLSAEVLAGPGAMEEEPKNSRGLFWRVRHTDRGVSNHSYTNLSKRTNKAKVPSNFLDYND